MHLRQTQMQLQRSQFDAEKKVAVADTSIQNLAKKLLPRWKKNKRNEQIQLEELRK